MSITIDRDQVRALRAEQLWSQEDLAAAAGLSARTVQRVEQDGHISLESLKALASALNVDGLSLVKGQMSAGLRLGVICGIGGVLIGYGFALSGLYAGLERAAISAGQAGAMAGLLGVFGGLCCALIAIAARRNLRHTARRQIG
ncbi:MAG: helix-turn-helix domain-containing protein [Pseudomonadota bacterium]